MIKLIVGAKGSGKTKTLVEMVNVATEKSKGSVVCIEKNDSLALNITYKARLIVADEYAVSTAGTLYGFIAGILASNSDITDLFVDSTLKICSGDVDGLAAVLAKLDTICGEVNVVMTVSLPVESIPDTMKAYL